MTLSLRLEDRSRIDVGLRRSANEDSLLAMRREQIWLIADGMGGHEHGKQASDAIVAFVGQADGMSDDLMVTCDAVGTAIHAANKDIFAQAESSGTRMGSTVVALIIRQREFAVLWAGDSRAYLYRNNVLYQLTRDHTQVQEMVDRGLLQEQEAAGHPMAHVLVRAVGVRPELSLDAIRDEAEANDIFLLCSDGVHGVLAHAEIERLLAEAGREALDPLISACLEKGAPDNISAILVHALEPTRTVFVDGLSA